MQAEKDAFPRGLEPEVEELLRAIEQHSSVEVRKLAYQAIRKQSDAVMIRGIRLAEESVSNLCRKYEQSMERQRVHYEQVLDAVRGKLE